MKKFTYIAVLACFFFASPIVFGATIDAVHEAEVCTLESDIPEDCDVNPGDSEEAYLGLQYLRYLQFAFREFKLIQKYIDSSESKPWNSVHLDELKARTDAAGAGLRCQLYYWSLPGHQQIYNSFFKGVFDELAKHQCVQYSRIYAGSQQFLYPLSVADTVRQALKKVRVLFATTVARLPQRIFSSSAI